MLPPAAARRDGAYTPVPAYDLANIRTGIVSDDGSSAPLFVNDLFDKQAQLESLPEETLPSAAYNWDPTNQRADRGAKILVVSFEHLHR